VVNFQFPFTNDECLTNPGKHYQLLSVPKSQWPALREFLRGHQHLAWMLHIKMDDYKGASAILENLGDIEQKDISSQKTMYSLAKLSKLAAEGPDHMCTQSDNFYILFFLLL
jgi:hypothetical protein